MAGAVAPLGLGPDAGELIVEEPSCVTIAATTDPADPAPALPAVLPGHADAAPPALSAARATLLSPSRVSARIHGRKSHPRRLRSDSPPTPRVSVRAKEKKSKRFILLFFFFFSSFFCL